MARNSETQSGNRTGIFLIDLSEGVGTPGNRMVIRPPQISDLSRIGTDIGYESLLSMVMEYGR